MDTQLRQLRRNATTKEDTLELLARAGRAGPETLHYETHAALQRFPTDEAIVKEFAQAHCRAIAYIQKMPNQDYTVWAFGNQGNYKLKIKSEDHFYQGTRPSLIVDQADIHLVREDFPRWRSLISGTRNQLDNPGHTLDIVTTPEGTYVHTISTLQWHTPGYDRVTNITTGESKTYNFERWTEDGRIRPVLRDLMQYEGQLVMKLVTEPTAQDSRIARLLGKERLMRWNDKSLSKQKSRQASKAYDLLFGAGPFPKYADGVSHPFRKLADSKHFPLDGEEILKFGKMAFGRNLGRVESVTSMVPISQHFYEKLVQKYGG